jgi:hypothetical protein
MIRTRLPVLIALIVAMILNCGVTVAQPNQTSADYVMPGCRDAASLITFSNVGESEEQVSRMGTLCGDCSWPQLHGSALKDSSAHARYSAAVIIESWASWIDASAIRSNAIPDLRCAKLRRSHVGIDSLMSLTAAANHHRRRNAGRTSSPRAGRSGKTRR